MQDPKSSPTLAINEKVKALWEAGETVYHFGFGESRFPVHPKLQTALAENAYRKGYLSVQGLPALRELMARYYGRIHQTTFSPDQIIVASGSKPLLFGLIMALDGDLLLPTPSWVSYGPQAKLIHKKVLQIPSTIESGYALTLDNLAATVAQSQTAQKILILNSPNNPTGLMFTAEFLQELANYCRANNIIVISDEIYGLVSHGTQPHISISRYYPEGTIIVGGLSKHLSLGGWRLGKAIIPAEMPELKDTLLQIGSEIWSTASAPIQYASIAAYGGDSEIEQYIQNCTRLHAQRTQHIWSWLNEMGIRCPQPQGGFYMMPDFMRWKDALAQNGVTHSAALSQFMLEKYHIATLPGMAFGMPPEQLTIRMATSYIDLETDEEAGQMMALWQNGQEFETFLSNNHPMLDEAIGQFKKMISDLNSKGS